MKTGVFEGLDCLIQRINQIYIDITYKWLKDKNCMRVNLRKKCISKIQEDGMLLNLIWAYRDFITMNEDIMHFVCSLNGLGQIINTRVKTRNSIEYKIENYISSHENGKIPINKCLNDLYGIRIILSEEVSYKSIRKYIEDKYSDLKCIDSSKGDYRAIHIYFRYDNYSFPWELQIWRIQDKENNLISHKQYKQEYTKWEEESKGGI